MSRPKSNADTKHLQFAVGKRSYDRLVELKDKTEVARFADVIQDALVIYEAFVEDILAGNEIVVRTKDGKEIPYKANF